MNKEQPVKTEIDKKPRSIKRVSLQIFMWLTVGVGVIFGLIAYGALSQFDRAEKTGKEISQTLLSDVQVVQNLERVINLGDQLVNAKLRDDWWAAGVAIQALAYHPSFSKNPKLKENLETSYQAASSILRQRIREAKLLALGEDALALGLQDKYTMIWEKNRQRLKESVDQLAVKQVRDMGRFSEEIEKTSQAILVMSAFGGVVGGLAIAGLYYAVRRHVLRPLSEISDTLSQLHDPKGSKLTLPEASNKEVSEIYSALNELQNMRETLEKMALYDRLSGLGNKNLFDELLPRWKANAHRNNQVLVVYFMDLDGFKQINDTYGHDVGNDVLRIVGARFANFSRSNDLYFRIGGDEFAALMFFDHDYQDGAERVCSRIIELIEQPIAFKASHLEVSISIGMAFYPHDSEHGEELISIADKNMYIAKKNKLGFVPSKKSANVVVMDTNRPKK